jgi:hypothetical protein
MASTYVDKIAEQTERFAGYLHNNGPREMFTQLERFARRDPTLFLGSAFTLGLVAARFLKSSGHAGRESSFMGAQSSSTQDRMGRDGANATGSSGQPSRSGSTQRIIPREASRL